MMGSFSCHKFPTILGLPMCEMKRNNITPDVKTYTLSTWWILQVKTLGYG
jgi:hypothetical protein